MTDAVFGSTRQREADLLRVSCLFGATFVNYPNHARDKKKHTGCCGREHEGRKANVEPMRGKGTNTSLSWELRPVRCHKAPGARLFSLNNQDIQYSITTTFDHAVLRWVETSSLTDIVGAPACCTISTIFRCCSQRTVVCLDACSPEMAQAFPHYMWCALPARHGS